MPTKRDLEFMRLAIREARRSIHKDERVHPDVGAVVVRDGDLLDSAYHGEDDPCDHAEFTVLEKKLPDETLAGCTVYTTLEPCTTRTHPKAPCVDRLIERKVSRVAVGMLDPNQTITGKGILKLRRHGIAVDLFPADLMEKLEELNRHFIRDQEALDLSSLTCPVRSRNDLVPMRDWLPAKTADDILIIGQNLSMVMRDEDFFQAKLAAETPLRLLIVNPEKHTRPDFEPALRTIRALRDSLPADRRSLVDLRTIDYVPTLSYQVLDGGSAEGTILVELAPNRIPVTARPHFVLDARNPVHADWYQRFRENCERMYGEAQPWQWD